MGSVARDLAKVKGAITSARAWTDTSNHEMRGKGGDGDGMRRSYKPLLSSQSPLEKRKRTSYENGDDVFASVSFNLQLVCSIVDDPIYRRSSLKEKYHLLSGYPTF